MWALALGMLICIAALVISPLADVPLTMVKAVHADAHCCAVVADVVAVPLLLVTQLPGSFSNTLLAERDVLSSIAAYRC